MAKIKIIERCENSHPVVTVSNGKPKVRYLVGKFSIGQVIEIGSEEMPQDRADRLIALGMAEAAGD